MAATTGEAITAAATTVAVAGTDNGPAGRPGVTASFLRPRPLQKQAAQVNSGRLCPFPASGRDEHREPDVHPVDSHDAFRQPLRPLSALGRWPVARSRGGMPSISAALPLLSEPASVRSGGECANFYEPTLPVWLCQPGSGSSVTSSTEWLSRTRRARTPVHVPIHLSALSDSPPAEAAPVLIAIGP
jgi:hypothetical protein